MEAKRNADNNEIANLELVLEQIANVQKSQYKSINELILAINSLSGEVTNIKEAVQISKKSDVSTDTLPILEMIKKGVNDIKLTVLNQHQKPILKKYQLLLFPEQDSKLFYKIVFGRWFLWLTIMLFLTNLYKLSVHYIDIQKEIQLQILENDRIKKSWDKLYFNSNPGIKKLMDNTYSQTSDKMLRDQQNATTK